jgi:Fic family protein
LDSHLNSFRVRFAYNNAKIENPEVTYNTAREIFEDGRIKAFRGIPETLTGVSNQRKCYTFLLPKIIAKVPMSVELIKTVHEITTMGTYSDRLFFELGERPGKCKKNDFMTGSNNVGSLSENIETDLTVLLGEIVGNSNLSEPEKVMKAATYFHMRFETVHPFADGNDRVAHTMMNYFLMTHNHPPLIVHDEDREEYNTALEHFGEDENIEPLFEFLMHQLNKSWAKELMRYNKR